MSLKNPWQSNLMTAVGNIDQIIGSIFSFLVVTVSLGSLCNVSTSKWEVSTVFEIKIQERKSSSVKDALSHVGCFESKTPTDCGPLRRAKRSRCFH